MKRVSWTVTVDPGVAWIESESPATVIGKVRLDPSNKFEKSSKTWSWPTDHPLNWSLAISLTVILNSWLSTKLGVVGMPAEPVRGSVNISLIPYPYPVFVILKSIIVEPWLTTTSALASEPAVPGLVTLWINCISLYDNGSSITIFVNWSTLPPLAYKWALVEIPLLISNSVALKTLNTVDPSKATSWPLGELLFALGAIIAGCMNPPET